MRRIGWLLLIVLAAGWLAGNLPLPRITAGAHRESDGWRRTRSGWEQRSWATPEAPIRRPALHPGVVGLLELFVSMAALIAFPPMRTASSRTEPKPAGHLARRPKGALRSR